MAEGQKYGGWAAKQEITTKGTKELENKYHRKKGLSSRRNGGKGRNTEAGHRSKNNHKIHERTLKEVSLNGERDFLLNHVRAEI